MSNYYSIETQGLIKRYPQIKGYRDLLLHPFKTEYITALENINLQVKKSELFCLLGPNGAGKTTLIKILCTLVLPTAGKALINGLDVTREEALVKKEVGFVVSDERSFYWRLTGRQNLDFFATLNNLPSLDKRARIDLVLELVGLSDEADRIFFSYSTGMKQRLALARGLLADPQILFLDEPTKSLDPTTAHHLRNFLKEKIVGEEGKTVFLATHNLNEAQELADRIGIIDRGKLRACGKVEEIRSLLGAEKRYRIEVHNLLPDKLSELKKRVQEKGLPPLQISSSLQGTEIETEYKGEVIPFLLEEIWKLGGKVERFYPEEASLEEIFDQVTRGEKDEQGLGLS